MDINYLNGKKEKFKGEDYIQFEKIVKIQDVYAEAIQYGNALLDLYTDIFNVIGSEFISLLAPPIVNKTTEFDMNKYIKTDKEIAQK